MAALHKDFQLCSCSQPDRSWGPLKQEGMSTTGLKRLHQQWLMMGIGNSLKQSLTRQKVTDTWLRTWINFTQPLKTRCCSNTATSLHSLAVDQNGPASSVQHQWLCLREEWLPMLIRLDSLLRCLHPLNGC